MDSFYPGGTPHPSAAGGADDVDMESQPAPSCNIAAYPPEVLFTAFANVAGPTPNLFVSIHGGTPEESNYKAFKEWTKSHQNKTQMLTPEGGTDWTLLDRAYTVTVPEDLIVVKIQKEFTNCITDKQGWMEEDLRYFFSSPFWSLATGAASGQIIDDAILRHAQVYLPGDKFYNQWLQFDGDAFQEIWKIPGGPGVEMENLRGKTDATRVLADPRRSYSDGEFPDGGAGGGMGSIPGMSDANDSRAKYLDPGGGVSLKEWSRKATSAGDELYEHKDWRHFDMQTLLNYLSMPGFTRGEVAPGPWLPSKDISIFNARGGGVHRDRVPLRVVYFFSCSPGTTSDNLHAESKAIFGNAKKATRIQVAEHIVDLRLLYRDTGHKCFLALREKLQKLGRIALIPRLKSWHAATALTTDEKNDGKNHFSLYWEDRSEDPYQDHPSQALTRADSASSMFSVGEITSGLVLGGGGKKVRKRRSKKHRRKNRTRRRKRRRKRTRRRRTRRKRRR